MNKEKGETFLKESVACRQILFDKTPGLHPIGVC